MTLYEYNQLSEDRQMEALWENGQFVTDRNDGIRKYILYSLFSFYVELIYHPDYNIMTGIHAFALSTQLDPYLESIDITYAGM